MDPQKEYESRLARWTAEAGRLDERHRRAGNYRLLQLAGMLVLAYYLRQAVPLGFLFSGIIAGIFTTGYFHDRIIAARDVALEMARFYQRGLERMRGTWMGKGVSGAAFADKNHPFAVDLDLFGPGSLFELINTAPTESGANMLAQWLLQGASPGEISARQTAVRELRDRPDFRELMAGKTIAAKSQIRSEALLAWAACSGRPVEAGTLFVAFWLPFLTWSFLGLGWFKLFASCFAAQMLLAGWRRKQTEATANSIKISSRDVHSLAELMQAAESEPFTSPWLAGVHAKWNQGGVSAPAALLRLASLMDWLDSNNNKTMAIFGPFFLLKTQVAFRIEHWRAKHGAGVAQWLRALGELEAMMALSAFAFEHPSDVMPEVLAEDSPSCIEAEGLAHPLVPEERAVRNDLALSVARPLHVISGSNMSGKSTWLRAIGANLVLAQAGAPVRARRFRATPLKIGASIRTTDSLQDGISKFYAEIKRLRQIADLAEDGGRVLFLIDEVLAGTNSHDRQLGAAHVAKSLVARGAIGLMTTHDLALTAVPGQIMPAGANYHFEDQFADGKLSFDYKLRPGIVEKSNALALMRSIGFEV